jgi:putative transposase
MKFDPEKHHRQSLRIKNRDYSRDGHYFVTICTRNRENIFADFCVGVGLAPTPNVVSNKGRPRGSPLQQGMALAPNFIPELVLTAAGKIIESNWRKINNKNIKTDAFVIMPNHIHGIIIIKPHTLGVGAGLAPALDVASDHGRPRGSPLHKNDAPALTLGSIIGAFKSRCVRDYLKFIDENNLNESAKIWQRNYHEHIIRDQKELAMIRNYIKSNPSNWSKDEENPLNL